MLLPASEEVEEWKVVCGQFLAINATNMSCACPRSPQGLSPAAHLGDGSSDLILIRKCSRFNFLRFLVRHTNQGDQVRPPLLPHGLRRRPLLPGRPRSVCCRIGYEFKGKKDRFFCLHFTHFKVLVIVTPCKISFKNIKSLSRETRRRECFSSYVKTE